MQVRIHVPGPLRPYADGRRTVDLALSGATVRELLDELEGVYPGMHRRVVDELGSLRRHVNIYVNGENIRHLDGQSTHLDDGDEVWVLPSISGGG
jgi:MoaD family protein